MKLYRPRHLAGHLVGEDKAGALLLFPAEPGGWAKRTPWTGSMKSLDEISPAEGRRTRWPGAIGGAPRAGTASKHQLGVRVTDDERTAWERAAEGAPLSDWIRNTCNAAASEWKPHPKGRP